MKKPTVALVRGSFLNRYDMQSFEPLSRKYAITAFGSLSPIHDRFSFPVVHLPSPMDIPEFPYKMPILNRMCVDAHYLMGLERRLRGYDIAHTAETYYHYTKQALDAKKRGWVKRVVATVWETLPHANEGIWGRRGFKARAIRELDHIIAVTEKAKEALVIEGANPDKITVIGAHIDTNMFAPKNGWLASVGDPKKRSLTILFCGRLVPEKGVKEVLDVMRRFAENPLYANYHIHWKFVGAGAMERDVIRENVQKGKNWHSTLESATYLEMPFIYRSADIFIAPSIPTDTWEEQYGMALLEAQACGLPIITTRSGGIPENVGDAAVLVPSGDTDALSHAIGRFVTDASLRKTFAARARARAVKVHHIRVGVRLLAGVYERVLSGK